MNRKLTRWAIGATLCCVAASAVAGVQVGGTRLVYDGAKREASISVKNTETKPYVVQSWIDNGDEKNGRDVPFSITPPIFRLDANKESLLRVRYAGEGLPDDRESVLWLNVQEIPPAPEKENVLQIAVRTRIKLIYRPSALTGDPAKAASELRWQIRQNDGKPELRVDNPSPYTVNLDMVKLDGQEIDGRMVLPKTHIAFPLPSALRDKAAGEHALSFTYVNDFGAISQPVKSRTAGSAEQSPATVH